MSVIRVTGLGVNFPLHSNRRLFRSGLLPFRRANGTQKASEFWALRGLSFEVNEGEIVGVIGPNGAGKSTLLRVLAGIYYPDEGEVQVDGSVSTLLSLGVGFRPSLSGRDNIYLNGVFLGMSNKDIDARFDDIVAFAELEKFIDTPVRNYSSGMTARLGFSIAMSTDPDILLIDEVLGVGDESFREKSQAKMLEFIKKAKAIVIVTHNMGFVRDFCNKALWIERGGLRRIGTSEDVVKEYLASSRTKTAKRPADASIS